MHARILTQPHAYMHTDTHMHTHAQTHTWIIASITIGSNPQDIAVSSGSACTSASLEPSYVLRALGVEEDMAHTSIRYGLGRFTTEEEVDRAVELTVDHVGKLREMSPLWEMVQEGVDIKSISWVQHGDS